ncbi:DUF1554 domain-containing protein [Leptospira kmetyi]|uniref:DUF1554 domain-containing protein n=1 Tax=Leptospira kmetyi TaxID=408139 RepID=UPI001FAE7E7F|nr:DUF1554 domain-containing protein [Leptospira kmetyi]
MFSSGRIQSFGIFLFFILSCSQAEKIEMDLSKGGIGAFLNILPSILPVDDSPFDSTAFPATILEGQSTSLKLTLKTRAASVEQYNLTWADTSAGSTVDQVSITYTGSNTINVNVTALDNDCLDDTVVLNATRISDSKVFALKLPVTDRDRCIFLASNSSTPGVTGAGFTANLGGIAGADAKCQAEKPSALPGSASEYKALLGIEGFRNPTKTGTSEVDWPLKVGIRYFSFSAQAPEGALIATGVSNGIGTGSAIFSFPLNSSINHSTDASALSFWTGMNSTFYPLVGTYTCSNYTDGTTGYGYDGVQNSTSSSAISSYYFSCTNLARLICVRQ